MTAPSDAALDLLLVFADQTPDIVAYEALARAEGLRIATDEFAPEYRLLVADGFRLMLVDGRLARLHVASYDPDFEDDAESDAGADFGIQVVGSVKGLDAPFASLLERLTERVGAPSKTGSATCAVPFEPGGATTHTFRYAAWERAGAALVLLMNDEGDAHINEMGTVDLRIAPMSCLDDLPASVAEPFSWPFDY